MKIGNEYASELGDLYARTPKAVLAAVAVSVLTRGGDDLDDPDAARARLLDEWRILHLNGIVPQAPPKFDLTVRFLTWVSS